MAILKRYPHTLHFGTDGVRTTARDENGDPIELLPTFTDSLECKAKPETEKGLDVVFDDGSVKKLAFTCYFKPQEHVFKQGDMVKLTLTTGVEVILLVVNFIPYQKTHKLWLA